MITSVGRHRNDRIGAGGEHVIAACCRRPCRRRRWRSPAARCPVDPVNLVWHPRVDTAISIPSAPTETDTKATTRVLPRCALVGLHCPVSPTPLTLSGKGQVGLDLDPIRPGREHRSRAEVYRKGRAAYRHRLVKWTR